MQLKIIKTLKWMRVGQLVSQELSFIKMAISVCIKSGILELTGLFK